MFQEERSIFWEVIVSAILSKKKSVYCDMTAESRNSGIRGMSIARQLLGKHIPTPMNTQTTIQ
jgi:hypothetical protein